MTVDAPLLDDLDAGLWLTVSEIARRKGKSKQAISKRIKSLVEHGLQTRQGQAGKKLVNLAQFDRLVGEVGDAAKEVGAETKAAEAADPADASPSASPAYRDHQAREKQYSADLKLLELEEKLGNVVPVADLAETVNQVGEIIVRQLDRILTHAEAMAAAVGKDGAAGARAKFKEIAHELREGVAQALATFGEPLQSQTPSDEKESDAG